MSEIIIKKSMFYTTVTIISSLFIFPFTIVFLLCTFNILFINFSFENLFFFYWENYKFSFENLSFLIALMVIFWIWLRNLISIIFFGMKALVINDVGITYYKWTKKTIYWKDIKKIELYNLDYKSQEYNLIVYMKNKKMKWISLVNISHEVSEEKIYKVCLNRLHKNK